MTSRLPGFHRLPLARRIEVLSELLGLSDDEQRLLLSSKPLDLETAERMIENAIGVYGLPLGLAANFQINGRDYVVPMVVEEPSIVAAASNSARVMRASGGIVAEADGSTMIGQIQVIDVPDAATAVERLRAEAPRLVEHARTLQPRMVARGGGAHEIQAWVEGDGSLAVHVLLDVGDAMGANAVDALMEALAPEVASITGGDVNLRILSNLSDHRLARASVAIPVAELETGDMPGEKVARRIAAASDFAAANPHRAATHNKGVMNGIDAVALATGQDWRAIEAGAHAYAARDGRYGPIAVWRAEGGKLHGSIELPLAVGTVGGRIRLNPRAQLGLRILGVKKARDLAMVMAAVGLAQNFGALRALCTEGIQRGHMTLHARGVRPGGNGSRPEAPEKRPQEPSRILL